MFSSLGATKIQSPLEWERFPLTKMMPCLFFMTRWRILKVLYDKQSAASRALCLLNKIMPKKQVQN